MTTVVVGDRHHPPDPTGRLAGYAGGFSEHSEQSIRHYRVDLPGPPCPLVLRTTGSHCLDIRVGNRPLQRAETILRTLCLSGVLVVRVHRTNQETR